MANVLPSMDKVITAEFLPVDRTKSEIHGPGIAQNFVDVGRVGYLLFSP